MQYRLLKHKMTRYSKNFGGNRPLRPLGTPVTGAELSRSVLNNAGFLFQTFWKMRAILMTCFVFKLSITFQPHLTFSLKFVHIRHFVFLVSAYPRPSIIFYHVSHGIRTSYQRPPHCDLSNSYFV